MNISTNKRRIIYWSPRILSIAFILFLSLFSLDVLTEYTGWDLALALFMHLLPLLVLLGIIIISWKYDLVGAIVFSGFGIFYVFAAGFNRPWSWYAFISGPAIIVGILFLLSWIQKRKSGE
ncbi:MAG: hypothetical protein WC514_01465 [Candidatus Paceibacterota bacterium]